MVTISSGLCFLPILWSFLLVVTVIVSRLMANNTEFDDSVHSASAFQWSHSIFSQLLDLLALVGLLSIFIRYLHLEVVTRGIPQETNASIGRLRLASLIFGVGTMTGITVISNFRQPGENGSKGLDTFHHTGRIVIGLCGITYCSLQAFITFQLAKLGLSTFKLFIFRIVISILLCVIGLVHVTMEVWLAVRFLKENEPYRPWYSHRGDNEAYFLDAFSDISEWLTFLLFAAFSSTYFMEFYDLGLELKCFLPGYKTQAARITEKAKYTMLNRQEIESSNDD